MKKSAIGVIAVFALAALVSVALGAAYRIVLVNSFDLQALAYYSAAFPVYALMYVVATIGLPVGVSRLVASRAMKDDYLGAQDILLGSSMSFAVVGVVLTLVFLLFSDGITTAMGLPGASRALKSIAPLFIIMMLLSGIKGYFTGLQLPMPNYICTIAENVLMFVLGLVFVMLFAKEGAEKAAFGGVLGITIAQAISLAVMAVLYSLNFTSLQHAIDTSQNASNIPYLAIVSKVWGTTAPVILSYCLVPFVMLCDVFMIMPQLTAQGYSAEVAATGFGLLEGIALPIACVVALAVIALMYYMTPSITAYRVRKHYEPLRGAASCSIKSALVMSLPIAVLMLVMAEPLVGLLFPKLTPADVSVLGDLLRTLGLGVPFLAVGLAGMGVLGGLRKAKLGALITLVCIVVKLLLMFILIRLPKLNLMGAAYSTTICFFAAGCLSATLAIMLANVNFDPISTLLKPLGGAASMAFVCYVTYEFIFKSFLGEVTGSIIAIVLGVALYGFIVVALGTFTREDVSYLPFMEAAE